MKDRVILVDADGVLLNWEYAFAIWMDQHGFTKIPGGDLDYSIARRYGIDKEQAMKLVKIFNESAAIGFLPPLRDAMYYVKRLHEEFGFVFHCITSLSTDPNAGKLREMNLAKLFGETAFEKVICLPTGSNKDKALTPYQNTGCWWIEDKYDNAEVGLYLGLKPLLMEHGHNMHYYNDHIPIVKNWKEVFERITAA